MPRATYSWILPIFNEAQSLPHLIPAIAAVSHGHAYEIIAVNDASTDNTLKVLKSLQPLNPQLTIVNLTFHQGKWPALNAGLSLATGSTIITLDADLQDDPGQVTKLLKKLHQGYDLVSGWRRPRHDQDFKVLISHLGNLLVSALTNHHFHDLNSPFKVFRRELLTSLPLTGSLFRFSLLFAHKSGFKTTEVPIRHRRRRFGESKFGLTKYLRILYDLTLVLLLFTGSGRVRRASGRATQPK